MSVWIRLLSADTDGACARADLGRNRGVALARCSHRSCDTILAPGGRHGNTSEQQCQQEQRRAGATVPAYRDGAAAAGGRMRRISALAGCTAAFEAARGVPGAFEAVWMTAVRCGVEFRLDGVG
jgi:hypothetical protein